MPKLLKKLKISSKKTLVIALGTVVLILGLLAAYQANLFGQSSIKNYAQGILDKCYYESYRPTCYDEEIPKLMDFMSMEDAFAVAKIVQDSDIAYAHCHVLGHKLAGRETAKNPDGWLDVISRCPPTVCNNGCLHGPILARFQSESLSSKEIAEILPHVKIACEDRGDWHPVEVEKSMCYHALGHLAMYVTSADIPKSVEMCKVIGTKDDGRDYVQTCTEGVFMQIFQGLDPEDFALVAKIKPKKEDLTTFCQPYSGEAFHACHREAWPMFGSEIKTSVGLTTFCTYTNDFLGQKKCFAAVMNIITVDLVFSNQDLAKLTSYCLGLPSVHQADCFGSAARRSIQLDPKYLDTALSICKKSEGSNHGDICYREIASMGYNSYPKQSEGLGNYCQKVPEKWRSLCLGKPN